MFLQFSISLHFSFSLKLSKPNVPPVNCPCQSSCAIPLPASLPAQLLPWSSAGSRAADVQSRMESSLALPCCVGSARLTEHILVCVWKFNSCSSGTQKADLQRKTTSLFSPANHHHLFCPEKERLHFLC